jgi:peptide/nickel transport system permease protein
MKTAAAWLARRLGLYAVAAWAAITLGFALPRMVPGDPAAALLARLQGKAGPEAIAALRAGLGVSDAPLPRQYLDYLVALAHGDLGLSVSRFPTPVSALIGDALGWTVLLAGVSVTISFTLGAALGLAAAWRGGWLDTVVGPALMLLGAFPYFWLAMVALHVFGFGLGWFPLRHAWDTSIAPAPTFEFGWGVVRHAALPALTLVAASVGGWMLGMRNSAQAVLATDQVLLARARGLPTARVLSAYVLRNAMLPHLTGFGMALGFVVSGALLTEVVFSYPGEGWLLVQAVRAQDYPLLQGLVLAITLAVLFANAIVDLLTLAVDPRTRAA